MKVPRYWKFKLSPRDDKSTIEAHIRLYIEDCGGKKILKCHFGEIEL